MKKAEEVGVTSWSLIDSSWQLHSGVAVHSRERVTAEAACHEQTLHQKAMSTQASNQTKVSFADPFKRSPICCGSGARLLSSLQTEISGAFPSKNVRLAFNKLRCRTEILA